ncbi:MAG: hypothetical protein AAGK32_08435, partial [Actinomycetota bacterium]
MVRLSLFLGLLVSACTPEAAGVASSTSAVGSASSSPSTTSTTVTGTLSTPSAAATGSAPEPDRWPGLLRADCDTAEPACNGPWEAAWEADRRAVIDQIVSGGHGVGADGVLRGPGGLAVDLSACPPSWAT